MSDIEQEIDDLIENFDMKPITDGLGFHHSLQDKRNITVSLKGKKKSLAADFENRMNQLKTETPKTTTINMGELAPFYNSQEGDQPVRELNLNQDTNTAENVMIANNYEATLGLRFGAWLLDMAVLTTLMFLLFTSIIFLAELPLEFFSIFMVSDDILISFLVITSLFYTFYFSFLDCTAYSTVGKRILGLKVKSTKGRMNLVSSFFRSCITLISIPLLCLPIMLKLHDRLTDTIVTAE